MPYGANGAYTIPAAGSTASSGKVIASADWNAIFADLATALTTLGGVGRLKFSGAVNFNAGNADTAIAITLPPWSTRYLIDAVIIHGASQTLSTATVGVFTAAAGAGTAIVTAASAITVVTASESTVNNAQALTVNSANIQSYTITTLYIRVATAQGAPATGTVDIFIRPL